MLDRTNKTDGIPDYLCSFEEAEAGSLWYYRPPVAEHELPVTGVMFYLIKENGDPTNLYDYGSSVFNHECVVVKLNNTRQVKSTLPGTEWFEMFYKILVVTSSGISKVGWLADWLIRDLEKCNEH